MRFPSSHNTARSSPSFPTSSTFTVCIACCVLRVVCVCVCVGPVEEVTLVRRRAPIEYLLLLQPFNVSSISATSTMTLLLCLFHLTIVPLSPFLFRPFPLRFFLLNPLSSGVRTDLWLIDDFDVRFSQHMDNKDKLLNALDRISEVRASSPPHPLLACIHWCRVV